MTLSNRMGILSRLPSNSSSPKLLFNLDYEIETLDVMVIFELTMSAEVEVRDIPYDTEITIGPNHYFITYYVYAPA